MTDSGEMRNSWNWFQSVLNSSGTGGQRKWTPRKNTHWWDVFGASPRNPNSKNPVFFFILERYLYLTVLLEFPVQIWCCSSFLGLCWHQKQIPENSHSGWAFNDSGTDPGFWSGNQRIFVSGESFHTAGTIFLCRIQIKLPVTADWKKGEIWAVVQGFMRKFTAQPEWNLSNYFLL